MGEEKPAIRQVKTGKQLEQSLQVIRVSFQTVADDMGITPDKAPMHPAYMTMERLKELQRKAVFFGLYAGRTQLGFVAVERGENGVFFMDRLAVLPAFRHCGYGRKLVEHLFRYVGEHAGTKVALGMIDSQTILKNWYKSIGFVETGTKQFEHLPFMVCFMERRLSA